MLDAAVKAITQMFSPAFRAVLLKSIGVALVLIVGLGIALQRGLAWLATSGGVWAESATGSAMHLPITVLVWIVSIAASLGIVLGAIFLMPAVTAFVGSFFVDEIAEVVEREYYPAEPSGQALPLGKAVYEGLKTALLAIAIYLCALPFLLLAGFGFVLMFVATSFLLGREYFELAAMRFRTPADAKAFRKANRGTVFLSGMAIAAFVSIPIVNLATPLFAMALMMHLYKKLAGGRVELLGPNPTASRLR